MMTEMKLFLCLFPFLLTVFASPPKLVPLSSHFDLVENNSFALICNLLSDGGQSTTFQWTANGVQLENSSDFRVDSSSSQFSLLTIRNLQQSHSGLYECRAVNSFGEADVTRTKINVQGNVALNALM